MVLLYVYAANTNGMAMYTLIMQARVLCKITLKHSGGCIYLLIKAVLARFIVWVGCISTVLALLRTT